MAKIHTKPTLADLTTEQKERLDVDYVAAVNRGLDKAVKQADGGRLVPAPKVWKDLGLED